jgi:Flp pilus assembly protein TadG
MKRLWQAFKQSERGASLIETALVLPLLLLLVAGIVDLGGAFNSYIIVTNAAREGARYASKIPDDDVGIRGAAKQEATNYGVILADGNIAIDPISPAGSGTPITVTVTFAHNTLLGSIMGTEQITVSAETSMIIYGVPEGVPSP